jgi:hypothetical protein
MEIAQTYSYRHAEAILQHEYTQEMDEIKQVISAVEWMPVSDGPVTRKRGGRVVLVKYIDQVNTNKRFGEEFQARGWACHPPIVSATESNLVADFKRGVVQVEVQFGNMARWYTDIFKFLLSYAANDIEIGVLVVPMQCSAGQIDENVVYFERVLRELPHAKMAVTIPVWVVGVNGGIAGK